MRSLDATGERNIGWKWQEEWWTVKRLTVEVKEWCVHILEHHRRERRLPWRGRELLQRGAKEPRIGNVFFKDIASGDLRDWSMWVWKKQVVKKIIKKEPNGREKIIPNVFCNSQDVTLIVLKEEKNSCEKFLSCSASWKIHDTVIECSKILILRSEGIACKIRVLVRQIFSESTESFSDDSPWKPCFQPIFSSPLSILSTSRPLFIVSRSIFARLFPNHGGQLAD